MDRRLKRVFVIVLDSMGMGAMADAARFGDEGADTLGHISQTVEHFYIPNLASLGLANLKSLKQVQPQEHPLGLLWEIKRSKQRKRHHDRTLGDDGD